MKGISFLYYGNLMFTRKFNTVYVYHYKDIKSYTLLFSFHLTNHSGLGGLLKKFKVSQYCVRLVYSKLNNLALVD